MKNPVRGMECHVVPGGYEQPTLIITRHRAALKRLEVALRRMDADASIQRHVNRLVLRTDMETIEILHDLILDDFDAYYLHDERGEEPVRISDPDRDLVTRCQELASIADLKQRFLH
jgi:hypothetical protein